VRRVVVLAVIGLAVVGGWAVPALAATPTVVNLPNPIAPITGLGNAVGGLAGDAAKDTAATVLDAVSTWVASGTVALLGSLAAAVDQQTKPDLTAGWFGDHYQTMAGIALLLALPLVFASAITAIVRQDAGTLARTVLVHLPIAAVGTAVAMAIVNLALAASDWLCSVVSGQTGYDADSLFSNLTKTLSRGGIGTEGFALVLVCVLVSVGAFFLTLELIVRTAAIYVAVLFLPLALIGLVWPVTARWGKRLAEMLAVLILSKFVVVAIIAMAVSAVGAGLAGGGLSSLLAGAALLLLAGAAPFTLLRMVPIVEAGMIGHLDGAARRAVPSSPVSSRDVVHQIMQAGGPSGQAPSKSPNASDQDMGSAEMTRSIGPDGTQAIGLGGGGSAGAGGAGVGAEAAGAGVAGAGAGAAGAGAAAGGPVGVVAAAGLAAARTVTGRVEGAAVTRLGGGEDDG
jgi:hypothetical protein